MKSLSSKVLMFGAGLLPGLAWSTSIHPVKMELTQGQSSSAIIGVGNFDNPAHAAFYRGTMESDQHVQIWVPVDFSAEYGNVEELFEKLDEASSSISDSESNGGSSGQGGSDLNIDFDSAMPNLEAVVSELAEEARGLAAFTALVALEGYARAELREEFALVLNEDVLNGTLKFSISRHRLTSAIGIGDQLNFDADFALQELEAAYNLLPGDPITRFDLSAGVFLTVDPANESVRFEFQNDSLLLTKAAIKTDVAFNYSALWFENDHGALYWGVTPIYREIGLTNIGVRFGDLLDSEELFEAIDDAEFVKDKNFTLDAGLIWLNQNYSFGASFYDLLQSTYNFPALENESILSTQVLQELEKHRSFKTETQATLEGSVFSEGGRWALSASLDTRAIRDPFEQDFQWASIRTDVFWDSWILSNANLAVHNNMTGSELTYLTVGADFLKYLSMDITSTFDKTVLEGDELPRGLSFSLGLQMAF